MYTNDILRQPFNRFLSIQKWLSLAIVSRTLSRILLTHSNHAPPSLTAAASSANGTARGRDDGPKATLQEMMDHVDAFATVSELERRERNPGWEMEKSAFLSSMKEAHTLLSQGMDPRIQRKGKWPLRDNFPEGLADDLFSWEAFVRYVLHES